MEEDRKQIYEIEEVNDEIESIEECEEEIAEVEGIELDEEIEEYEEDDEFEDEQEFEEEAETEDEDNFEENVEYPTQTKSLRKLVFFVAVSTIMLISSTYAWFSTQKNVRLANLEGTVNVAEGLQVSLDAKNWSNSIDFSTYDQETELKRRYGLVDHNIIPTEMLPVSTTGKEAIGQTEMTFYRGINNNSIELDTIVETSLYKADGVTLTTATANPDTYPGYYAIDFFLENSSRTEGLTGDQLFDVLQLNADSAVQIKAGGNTTVGLQNTPRIAFALYNTVKDEANGKIVTVDQANQETILAATTGAGVTIKDIAIWEPNAGSHEDYIVTNNNKITWKAADKVGYLGTEGQTTGKYTATERIPTYALKSSAVGKEFSDIYKWDGSVTDFEKQITLQTNKSASTYLIDGGVKNLISINSAETALYTNSPTGTTTEFKIPKNEVCRVRMYIWLEGQDVDCINYASHGGGIEVDVGLIKHAEVGSNGSISGGGSTPGGSQSSDITAIALDNTEGEVAVGNTFTLRATLNEGATDEITWTSSEEGVATVQGSGANLAIGTVTPVSAGTTVITATNSDNSVSQSCTVTVTGGNIAETSPYLPTGFDYVSGTDLDTGLVIEDGSGNQYVWVEVPRSTTVYDNLNYDLDSLTGTALTNAYTAIETDLKEYTNTYRKGTKFKDEYYSVATTGLTSTQYTEKKNKMLKSIYENGGFYVGRYEAGIATNRTSHTTISETLVPTSKENQYPLTYVYCSEAQTLASRVLTTGEHTSSLMFGVQWDLVLRYLQSKGASTAELNSDSTEWGNYNNSIYTLNRGKYSGDYGGSWNEYTTDLSGCVESSTKKASKFVLYTTGASDRNNKQNIYDLAGNVFEWTLEYTSDTSYPCADRGGFYYIDGDVSPASYRNNNDTTNAYSNHGFRVSLY